VARVDIARVAEAARAAADSLVREWLPDGHREGHEWKARNPTRADGRIGSFSINLNSGAWADFATDDKGGDLVSLYAYLNGVDQLDAARAVAKQLGMAEESKPTLSVVSSTKKPRTEWTPIVPAPADAGPLPKAHVVRGKFHSMWTYRGAAGELLGAVYRFTTSDGGKEMMPCVFAQHAKGAREWRWLGFPEPKPLYGLPELAKHPTGPVLVVEGEKCVDAAHALINGALPVVTWSGGVKQVNKADWAPLYGRKVIIWPDCDAQLDKGGALLPEADQPGIKAAERIAELLTAHAAEVRIISIPAPGAKPGGWDVADAIALDGWTREQVGAFIRDHLRAPKCSAEVVTPNPAPPAESWRADLVRAGNGSLLAGVPNAYLNLTNRPEWRGVLAFDEFASHPVKRLPPPYPRGVTGEWDENDDSHTAFWLATRAGLARISSAQAAEAAEMAARAAPFDPVRDYLDALPAWDGTNRLDMWLSDYFGAAVKPYTALVGRFWLMGMVRRVYEPGCKFDYMPILEGPQGRGKSTALEILSAPWFGNTDFVMGDKDSMAVMQGKWLYEIAELDSFNKADTTRVKSFVTRQVDEFRPAYGRRILKLSRRVVLVGTTNQYEYFKDATGNRRFWPIQCREQINLEGLRGAREQLLAEAVARYRKGERTYPSREEQELYITPEQETREIADAWEDGIYRYLAEPDAAGEERNHLSMFDILCNALKIDAGKITKDMSTRVGICMRKLGWHKRERRGENPRFVYERPKKTAPDGADTAPTHVPF
jgi:putative DNA primase/helicase